MNRSPSDRTLNDLADAVADEFEAYRHSNGFNEPSLVIDNSNRDRSTLVVHINREQPVDLADRVEAFLRDHGAQTQASATPAPTSTCSQPSISPESNPH